MIDTFIFRVGQYSIDVNRNKSHRPKRIFFQINASNVLTYYCMLTLKYYFCVTYINFRTNFIVGVVLVTVGIIVWGAALGISIHLYLKSWRKKSRVRVHYI